jgi:tRNA (guanosine-2'-O-)-methyltransferase
MTAKQLDGTGLKRLHRSWRHKTERKVALILEGVQSPFNVGSIVRTAASYRVDHVWLAGNTAALDTPAVRKTGLGTERYLTWTAVERGVDAVAAAKAEGYDVLAVELADEATALHERALGPAVCLVLGNEDHGVSAAVLGAVDGTVFLPQLGRVGSLNVATAAALAIYEARRQEWTAHG